VASISLPLKSAANDAVDNAAMRAIADNAIFILVVLIWFTRNYQGIRARANASTHRASTFSSCDYEKLKDNRR
jgi:hypothetical protein